MTGSPPRGHALSLYIYMHTRYHQIPIHNTQYTVTVTRYTITIYRSMLYEEHIIYTYNIHTWQPSHLRPARRSAARLVAPSARSSLTCRSGSSSIKVIRTLS